MNKKIIPWRITFTILLLSTYALIFIFSCENGEKSSKNSKGMMYVIIDAINGNNDVGEKEIEIFEPILRKLAHFGIYTVSGIWGMCLMNTFFRKTKSSIILENEKKRLTYLRLLISTVIGFSYACSDEIHQLFSAGRSGKVIDVAIDTMGVINGSLLVLLVIAILKKQNSVIDH